MSAPDLNFGDLFDELATRIPHRPAIICGDLTRSWQSFDERSNRLARLLLDRGLKTGSKVAFYLRNSPAYIELFSACVKARLTHANVNYRYVDKELYHVLDNADAEAVVYDAEFRSHVEAMRPALKKVRVFLEVGDAPQQQTAGQETHKTESFEAACSEGDASPLGIRRSGDDLYFMYTGGTTGYPKAVMWPHKERIAVIGMSDAQDAATHAEQMAQAPSGPVLMAACPLMHSTGFTGAVSTLVAGGCVVLLPSAAFDASVCLREIERHQIKRLAIVGDAFSVPILSYLRQHPDEFDLSSVELITSAGAMWSSHCKQELLEYFPQAILADSLGSSEGSRLGAATTQKGDAVHTAAFQRGPGVKIFTEDYREVEPGSGEAGMIAKAGPLPLGYYKDEERTASTFPVIDGVRYSMPGDWCRVEADGSLTLLGRGNNCINTGGEKVFPEEVEEALKTHTDIVDAAVFGIPDERWGQAIVALVRPVSNAHLSHQTIGEHLSSQIARYKHPKEYRFVTEDFRHDNGKVNYRYVQSLWVETAAN